MANCVDYSDTCCSICINISWNILLDSTSQSAFFPGQSSTYSSDGGEFYFTYQNGSTNGTEGVDTIIIAGSYNMTNEKFGLGRYDDEFFEDGLSFVFLFVFFVFFKWCG